MWNRPVSLLIVQIKLPKYRGFKFPVPIWVIDEFFEALTDLAFVGELALKQIPLPSDEKAGRHWRWIKTSSPSGVIGAFHNVVKDLAGHRGLDMVDVEVGDIKVKVRIT
ncbi:hypothetical protein [Desulfosporosinus youngiae]|uniref:Uncharacterized protein n=1 Tax=Desulfosporosinus youngiae DSM 17734 TaxID=768710 RepID=H5Y447_9FIRM|nr:hypothetical protein [Desulfosporosinus youngiae]EHQ89728.1 hypothetical protein DesyoDRAFT_2662 [Desulfosporosinus youngiae DSM 17734]